MDVEPNPPIRRMIEQVARRRLPDATWAHLVASGRIEEVERGTSRLEDVVADLEELERTFDLPGPRRPRWPEMLTADAASATDFTMRDEALSRVVAVQAKYLDEVHAFRTAPEHELPPDLVLWAGMEMWIMQVKSPRRASWFLDDQPIPDELNEQIDALVFEKNVTESPRLELPIFPGYEMVKRLHLVYLAYGIPNERRERFVAVRAGSTLDRLRQLSEKVAKSTRWSRAQTTIWILTGLVPLIRTVSAEIDQDYQMPALSRIVLTIDPAVSPRELAEQYKEIRTYLIGERHRDLTEKHTLLALFSVTDGQGTSVAEAMRQWNAAHPEWAYHRDTNFARDMRQAQQRLLGIAAAQRARVARSEGLWGKWYEWQAGEW